jgi:hypothetical protein
VKKRIDYFEGYIPGGAHLRVQLRCHCGKGVAGIYSGSSQPLFFTFGRRDDMFVLLEDEPDEEYRVVCDRHKADAWTANRSELLDLFEQGQASQEGTLVAIISDGVVALRSTSH